MGNGGRRDEEVDGHSSSRNLRKIDNAEIFDLDSFSQAPYDVLLQ